MTSSGGTKARRSSSPEIVSLAERMGLLQVLRTMFAAVVLLSGIFAERDVGAGANDLLSQTISYLVVTAAIEGLRRAGRARGLMAVAGMLIIDGVYLAWVLYLTGGTVSPLRFLVYIHLIAVTLLASYRTGLKIALWHSLLFFVTFHAQLAGLLDPRGVASGNVEVGGGIALLRPSIFNVMAFWLVALATAGFSSINERELRRRKLDAETFAEMAALLEHVKEPSIVSGLLLDRVVDRFDFPRGVVLAGPDGHMSVMATHGMADGVEDRPCSDALLEDVLGAHSTRLVKALDDARAPRLAALMPGAHNVVVVPLFADGLALGVLVVEQGQRFGSRIDRRAIAVIDQLCSHAALALRNTWLLEEVQWMAETDPLTGLANRRTFQSVLESEISRASRGRQDLTLIMLDLDHFKSLNDNWGHQVGDQVLRSVGARLADACRDFDTAARYGGEEFAIVLPGCSSEQSLAAAERFRKLVSEIRSVVPISASAGVATFPHDAGSSDDLIKSADEALYLSKNTGRDRSTRFSREVVLAPETAASYEHWLDAPH